VVPRASEWLRSVPSKSVCPVTCCMLAAYSFGQPRRPLHVLLDPSPFAACWPFSLYKRPLLAFVRIFFLLYPFLVLNSVRFLFAADNSVVLLSSSFLPNVDPLRYSPFLLFPLLARSFAANLIYMCHVCSASSRFNLRAYVHSLRYSKRSYLLFFISFLYLVYYAMCSF
jgi:hypothetical protein